MLRRYLTLLIRCMPPGVRRRLGKDLEAFWLAQVTERRYSGWVGRTRFLVAATVDVAVLAIRAGKGETAGRAVRSQSGLRRLFRGVAHDVRSGIRLVFRSPLYALVAVTTLAVGIGATTSVFAVLFGVLLRPLPFPEARNLVTIYRLEPNGETDTVAWPDFRDWREQVEGFDGMAAYMEAGGTLQHDGGAESLDGIRATHDLFDVVGFSPLLGRTFTPGEMAFNGPEAVILSYELWADRFGADSAVIGRVITLDGKGVPVVGVMPRGFAFPSRDTRLWMPLHEDRVLQQVGLPTGGRSLSFLQVVARLASDVPLGRAQEELSIVARRIDEAEGKDAAYGVGLLRLQEMVVGDVRTTLVFVFGAVTLVLLVACSNVAGLALGRAVDRGREMAMRAALGASRIRIARQVLIENAVLSCAGGVLGVAAAVGILRLVTLIAPRDLPRIEEIRFDASMLAFGVLCTGLCGVLLGTVPTAHALTNKRLSLGSGRSGPAGRATLSFQRLLVTGQVALAVALLMGASLLARSYARLNSVERGFQTDGIFVALVDPSFPPDIAPERIDAFYDQLLERAAALPGVNAVTSTYSPPFSGNGFRMSVSREDDPDPESATWIESIIVRNNYFTTLQIPLISGRDFDERDRLETTPVVIVNQTLTSRLWPGQEVLGDRLVFKGGVSGSADSFDRAFFPRTYTVVGVVGDTRDRALGQPPEPAWYRPHSQVTWSTQFVMLDVERGTQGLATSLRELVWSIDPTVPVQSVTTLKSQVMETVALPRFRSFLLVTFAGIAVLLVAVGLYSVIALSVARRRREIGIRMALGADARTVVRHVLSEGGRMVAVGVVVGVGGGLAVGRGLRSMLYEITPADPSTYVFVLGVLVTISISACMAPAIRAGRTDPVRSLKAE